MNIKITWLFIFVKLAYILLQTHTIEVTKHDDVTTELMNICNKTDVQSTKRPITTMSCDR